MAIIAFHGNDGYTAVHNATLFVFQKFNINTNGKIYVSSIRFGK